MHDFRRFESTKKASPLYLKFFETDQCTLTRQFNSEQIVPIQFWTKLASGHSAALQRLLL